MTSFSPSSFFSSRRGRRWLTLPAAWAVVLLFLLLGLAALLWGQAASPVYAESPDGLAVRVGKAYPQPRACHDRNELASVMQAEGGAQPYETQIAIMQIVKREADSRHLTICELTHQKSFVSVRHYADAHPNSWTAAQFRNPYDWALDLAEQVMLDRLPDATGGMGHWDGNGTRIILRP